jgi:Ca2+-binding EF-hand superfamily protein
MGACYSDSVYEDVKIKKFKEQFEALQLSANDIGRLHTIFNQIDVDFSGTIGLAELLAHIDLDQTTFTESVFSIFDEDGSGEIDFREFVISLWNYCTLSRATLGQ